MQYVIQKSYVQAHERKLKSGQVVQIQAHYDKRTKKHTEHAPEHGHDVSHLSSEEKDLFNRMHREQHFMAHYHSTGYRKMAQHHESRASELETEAVEHEKAGRKKRASKLRDSATKHREKATKYHDAAGKMDKIVQGIGALKEKLVAGSGKLADEDTSAAHARYAEKAGHKFKTLAPKQASDKPTESGHAEGDKWVMPLKAAVEEHKELVQAAETPTKADDKAQLAEQKAELARMEANHNPLNEAQRKSIEQSNSAWEAWKSGVETPSRAAFREQARSGKLDHLYALAEEDKKRINAETEQRQAEAKQRQQARNDAWREKNLPRLAAAKKVSEDFERNQQAAKVAAVKERLDAEQAKKEAAAAAKKARNEQASNAAPAKRTLPKTGRVSNDDPSVWGSWLLGHEGESWAHVRTLAPAHLQDDYSAPKVVVQKDVAEQIQGKIGAESAVPKTKNRKGKKTPESEWPQKRRDVISGLKERGWVIAPDNDKTAELLVDGHHVGSANLHMNFPEEVLTRLTKRNPAWVDSDAASKKFKVSGGESAGEIAENIDKMARAHHEIVAPPEKRTVLAEKPPLNVATKLQGKDVVFTKTSSFGVIDGRAIAQYGEHLRDHKFKNGYYADYRDATPDEVKASEKEAAKAAKKAAADAKKAAAKFMNAPSGYASFDDWYADADMPTKLEDGTWVDLETGLPYRAADSRSPKSRSGNAASSKPKRESAPSAPVPQGLPPFSDGKTKGAADYYVKIAQNLLEASKKPHARSALMAERSKTFTTKAGNLATAWASETKNSKLLVEFFKKLLNG